MWQTGQSILAGFGPTGGVPVTITEVTERDKTVGHIMHSSQTIITEQTDKTLYCEFLLKYKCNFLQDVNNLLCASKNSLKQKILKIELYICYVL
jgi:hypothetical protein